MLLEYFSVLLSLFSRANPSLKLPGGCLVSDLPHIFNNFFVNKISDIHVHAKLDATLNPKENYDEVESVTSQLRELIPGTESEIHEVVMSSKNCTTLSDPIPTSVLKKCVYPGSALLAL